MSKLEQIQTFIQVVTENGFAAAARKSGTSTAAVSRQIARLEADLGVSLLQRTTRTLTLTDLGLQYYQHCKQLLLSLQDTEAALLESHSEASGVLSLTANRHFAKEFILPRLAEFTALHPKIVLKLELAERFPDLVAEGIDLLFGVSMEGATDLVRRRVASTRYVLCAAPAYLQQSFTPKVPADLFKHRYLTHSMRKPDNALFLKNGQTLYLEPSLWLNDSEALRTCALQGMGLVNLHDYVVADALASGELIEVLPNYQERERYVYLYYQKSRYLQPKIRRFIDFYLGASL